MSDIAKRMFDISVALVILALSAPLILLLIAVIRWQTPGPGLFRQTRVGRQEKPFILYKLRSMYVDTPDQPTHEACTSTRTPVGIFLRKSKLDELPQLCNVLSGDMSLVGPRPCLPTQSELTDARRQRDVFDLRPGMTGLAQVLGVDMRHPERLARLDALYKRKRSMLFDIKLLVATIVRPRSRR